MNKHFKPGVKVQLIDGWHVLGKDGDIYYPKGTVGTIIMDQGDPGDDYPEVEFLDEYQCSEIWYTPEYLLEPVDPQIHIAILLDKVQEVFEAACKEKHEPQK